MRNGTDLEDAKQADVARRLGVSRPTVSRLLSEARREGIVRIEVIAPVDADLGDLGRRTADALGLDRVWLSALPSRGPTGERLAPALASALREVGLEPGDVLLVSSGRPVYEAAQVELPLLPGVLLVPTIGGQDEPEPWFATNEVTRQMALKVGGAPAFLHSPALPSPELYETLQGEAAFRRVLELWSSARCAVLGVGAPPLTRATTLSILAGARGGYFNQLVTDAETAAALVAAAAAAAPGGT